MEVDSLPWPAKEKEGADRSRFGRAYLSRKDLHTVEAWVSASAAARNGGSMNTRHTGSLQQPWTTLPLNLGRETWILVEYNRLGRKVEASMCSLLLHAPGLLIKSPWLEDKKRDGKRIPDAMAEDQGT